MTRFQVTVRHGLRFQRYHTLEVEAGDVVEALRLAADAIPDDVRADADLVELRRAVDADDRAYMEEGGPGG